MINNPKLLFDWTHRRIRSFHRNMFFIMDRFKIPRSERRVLSLLLMATLLIRTVRLFIHHPQLIDPSIYEEEQAVFQRAFATSYQDHQEILQRYGINQSEVTYKTMDTSLDFTLNSSASTLEKTSPDTIKMNSPDSLPSLSEPRVNLNTATIEQLITLPGIGPSYAARIIQWRNNNGKFTSIEQLLLIKGIGEKRLEKLIPFVEVITVDSTGYNR